mmetsp:Transcript_16333/g.40948  ORF Transcript_16333/g.40948 Transcript_16333/m.40948 type:complete len:129 (-) Transcript_16333:92-478(-)
MEGPFYPVFDFFDIGSNMTQGLLPKFTTSAPTISPTEAPTAPRPTIEPTTLPEDLILPDLDEDLVEEYIEVDGNLTDDYVDVLRNETSADEDYDEEDPSEVESIISVSIGGGKLEKSSDRNLFLRKRN